MKKFKKQKKEKTNEKLKAFFITGAFTFIIAVVLYGILIFAENKVLGEYDKKTVYIAKTDIAEGSPLTPDLFELRLIDSSIVPSDAMSEISGFNEVILSYYADRSISKNNVLCAKDITLIAEKITGTHEIGISVGDASHIVNGIIRTSDLVDIYIINGAEETAPVFKNVYVAKVFSGGVMIPNDDTKSVVQSFNVLLSEEEANRLISLMQTGEILIVKVEPNE